MATAAVSGAFPHYRKMHATAHKPYPTDWQSAGQYPHQSPHPPDNLLKDNRITAAIYWQRPLKIKP